jgi:hypothetical protein
VEPGAGDHTPASVAAAPTKTRTTRLSQQGARDERENDRTEPEEDTMPAATRVPHLDLAAVMAALTEDIVNADDPPEAVIDRYFTSDVIQISDGSRFDRDELIAHVRPVRKNLVDFRYELHNSVSAGDRLAARYTLHGRMRNGRSIATEVYAFGERAADGRLHRIDQLTRELPADDSAQAAAW